MVFPVTYSILGALLFPVTDSILGVLLFPVTYSILGALLFPVTNSILGVLLLSLTESILGALLSPHMNKNTPPRCGVTGMRRAPRLLVSGAGSWRNLVWAVPLMHCCNKLRIRCAKFGVFPRRQCAS